MTHLLEGSLAIKMSVIAKPEFAAKLAGYEPKTLQHQ